MSDRTANLLAEALQLTEEERGKLVEGLLLSLDDPPGDVDRMSDDELFAELDRRADEMRRDPGAGMPWEEVQKLR